MTTDADIPTSPQIRRAPAGRAERQSATIRGGVWIALFLLCVVQPFNFTIGGILLSPLRLFILCAALPLAIGMMRGAAGRLILPDYLLLGYVLWLPVPVLVNHGAQAPIPLLVISMFETLVPYMLARLYIRDVESFRFFGRWMLRLVLVLIPFAAVEAIADHNLISQIYGMVPGIDVFRQVEHPPRLGLHRAQGSFEHPILFGVFAVIPLALAWRALFRNTVQRAFWTGVSTLAVFFSLSSGALFAAIFQFGLLGYDIVLRRLRSRWRQFVVLAVLAYGLGVIFIESNPIVYAISNFTFNGATAFNRVRIWQLGTDVVAANPIFGIAYSDWPRPAWMPASVDNYWLLVAMRYGLVGFALFTGAVVASLVRATRIDLSAHPDAALCRSALLISFGGTALALATVFVWSGTYATLMFLLGTFAWLGFPPDEAGAQASPRAPAASRTLRYTRFAPNAPSGQGHARTPTDDRPSYSRSRSRARPGSRGSPPKGRPSDR